VGCRIRELELIIKANKETDNDAAGFQFIEPRQRHPGTKTSRIRTNSCNYQSKVLAIESRTSQVKAFLAGKRFQGKSTIENSQPIRYIDCLQTDQRQCQMALAEWKV
jgi:hypothetical protein